jgi:hypothetical protein
MSLLLTVRRRPPSPSSLRLSPIWRLLSLFSFCVFIYLVNYCLARRNHRPYVPRSVALFKRSVSVLDSPAEPNETPSYVPYLDLYSSIQGAHGRVLAFVALVLWLFFLFASVGIVASDFFCPNLGTLSGRMGMSEGVVSQVTSMD